MAHESSKLPEYCNIFYGIRCVKHGFKTCVYLFYGFRVICSFLFSHLYYFFSMTHNPRVPSPNIGKTPNEYFIKDSYDKRVPATLFHANVVSKFGLISRNTSFNRS